jgi:hypothetical protein
VENLDRLSREEERTAPRLWMDLLDAGVNIVQLHPETIFRHERSDMFDIMRAIMELSRGHQESALKSNRVSEAWGERRRRTRENGEVLTRRLPAWVEEKGGKLVARPDRAAAIRRIFELTVAGLGMYSLARRLTAEKVPAFGPSGCWQVNYINLILGDRRVTGEYQPRKGDQPDGPPIPDYFPRVVSEELWERARGAVADRRRRPGRVGARVNVFQGLLRSAKDGSAYYVNKESGRHPDRYSLRSMGGRKGTGGTDGFPARTFEEAVLSRLREIDPQEVTGDDSGGDEVLALAGQFAAAESAVAAIEADLDEHGESPALYRRLRAKEAQMKDLAGRLAEARKKAAHPLSDAWGEARTLLDALKTDDDRLRLRSALRRIVEEVRLLVVGRGRDRLCACQVWFAGGEKHRDYLILHRRPVANGSARVEGGWWCRSLAEAAAPGDLDLREPQHARELGDLLACIDLAAVVGEGDGRGKRTAE